MNAKAPDTTGEPTITPYRSSQPVGNDSFGQLLRSEWTKFRTIRGWVIAMVAAAVLVALPIVALGNAAKDNNSIPNQPIGPNGLAVVDSFYFQHRPIGADATITARVTALTGHTLLPPKKGGFIPPGATEPQPWAKAGVIVKAGTGAGSAYAAILVTPDHGVRFQYDFTHDIAGLSGPVGAAAPRWIRLTRAGDLITGYDSVNGRTWSTVGTVRLHGLPATAQAGLFVTSPTQFYSVQQFANNDGQPFTTVATGKFDRVALTGAVPGASWRDTQVGAGQVGPFCGAQTGLSCGAQAKKKHDVPGSADSTGGVVTLSGAGDIAPYIAIVDPIGLNYKGSLIGLIVVIALAALFITSEYRRGMIRTTFIASPRRGRILTAKAIVIGSTTFVAGLVGAAVAFPIAEHKIAENGWPTSIYPIRAITSGIGLQLVIGTAALLAIGAVLTLAIGALLRRSAGTIAVAVLVTIFPLVLATVLPQTPADWLLRLTPAAGFGLQQGNVHYSQVSSACLPYNGCYPLAPWTGFGVLCAWALAGLVAAVIVVRRRDA
ncbi:MAG TPA: ABC transporter permease subunit [Streptosporangiaceae bacterium]|nr:ABC transporter permease subunit [Streptosporangiaceae bacterium]